MNKLPYVVKELINLFALNTFTDYEMLCEFNKIIDYKPCKYSNEKLLLAYKKKANIRRHDDKEYKRKFALVEVFSYMNLLMYEYKNYYENIFKDWCACAVKFRRIKYIYSADIIIKWFSENKNTHDYYKMLYGSKHRNYSCCYTWAEYNKQQKMLCSHKHRSYSCYSWAEQNEYIKPSMNYINIRPPHNMNNDGKERTADEIIKKCFQCY